MVGLPLKKKDEDGDISDNFGSEQDMSMQEFSIAIVPSESQFPTSYIKESQANINQMPLDLEVFEVKATVRPFVLAQPNVVAHVVAWKAATK
ncbi:hypothetical protein D1007_62115 [Hordeum vulgare]|nr:hypothetical protein D1007_62115 [Hordeum vulgare]